MEGIMGRDCGERTLYAAYSRFVAELESCYDVKLIPADLCGDYTGGETLDNRADEDLQAVKAHCKGQMEFPLGEILNHADSGKLTDGEFDRCLGEALGWLAYYEFEFLKNRGKEDHSLREMIGQLGG